MTTQPSKRDQVLFIGGDITFLSQLKREIAKITDNRLNTATTVSNAGFDAQHQFDAKGGQLALVMTTLSLHDLEGRDRVDRVAKAKGIPKVLHINGESMADLRKWIEINLNPILS